MRTMLALATTLTMLLTLGVSTGTEAQTRTVDCGAGANLQAAIERARPGDTLIVRGTCVGQFEIGKDLTLRGRGSAAALHGTDDAPTSLVHVGPGADVAIVDLLLTGNQGSWLNGHGGGVHNEGDLRLVRSRITGNWGGRANAIHNQGRVWLRRSTVTDNTWEENRAIQGGRIWARDSLLSAARGGIDVERLVLIESRIDGISSEKGAALAAGTLKLIRSTIREGATYFGGLINAGELTLIESAIRSSHTEETTIRANRLVMRDSVIADHDVNWEEDECVIEVRTQARIVGSRIVDNKGIALCLSGPSTIIDSVINGNASREAWLPAHPGGIRNSGTLRIERSRIFDNRSPQDGGGIYNAGRLRLHRVHIYRNVAEGKGGGIFNTGTVQASKVWMWKNEPDDCSGC